MTQKKKTRYPIESFGPELMELLLKGSREVIVLEFEERRLAKKLQIRLHMLRSRMRDSNHPQWKIAAKAMTSLKYENGPSDPAVLTIKPRDSEFAEVFTKAKINSPKADPLHKAEGIRAPELDSDPLEDM